MHRLIAIAAAETGQRVETAGRIAGERVTVIGALGLAAILLPQRKGLFTFAMARKAQLEGLLQDQKALEALQTYGAILPAVQGAKIADAMEALGLLAANADRLRQGLADYGAARQFQITIAFDDMAALGALKDDAAIRAAAKAGPAALQAEMLARRNGIADEARRVLAGATLDRIDLPTGDGSMLLNIAVLAGPDGDAALDHALEAIDGMLSAALAIKVVGPLPAVSFAAVTIEKPEKGVVQAALRSLGLTALGAPQEVRAAYHERMRQTHPDAGGASDAAANERDAAAYRLLMRLSEAEAALRRSGAVARIPLLLDLRRDGEARRAA